MHQVAATIFNSKVMIPTGQAGTPTGSFLADGMGYTFFMSMEPCLFKADPMGQWDHPSGV